MEPNASSELPFAEYILDSNLLGMLEFGFLLNNLSITLPFLLYYEDILSSTRSER